jgi:hypothetical protein
MSAAADLRLRIITHESDGIDDDGAVRIDAVVALHRRAHDIGGQCVLDAFLEAGSAEEFLQRLGGWLGLFGHLVETHFLAGCSGQTVRSGVCFRHSWFGCGLHLDQTTSARRTRSWGCRRSDRLCLSDHGDIVIHLGQGGRCWGGCLGLRGSLIRIKAAGCWRCRRRAGDLGLGRGGLPPRSCPRWAQVLECRPLRQERPHLG